MTRGDHGPNASGTLAELRRELVKVRHDGWASQDEELAYGIRSVAGPVVGQGGRMTAGGNIAVSARDWSAARLVRELKPLLLETCRAVSGLLADAQAPA